MGTLEDIVAATKILAGDSETPDGGPGSEPEDIQVNAFDVKKVDVPGPVSAISKRVVETETVVETIFDDDSGLGHSVKEEKGVENLSSLLNGGVNVSVNVNDLVSGANGTSDGVNGTGRDYNQSNGRMYSHGDDEQREDNGDKVEDLDCEFLVGDFVWGKIKSHPWWPGQVYDPSIASEFAVKHGQEGRLLVAFFGDGSCSWCIPSQLTPFVQTFEKMSKDSSSNSFLYAVQRALDEVGRIMELEMTCKCITEELKVGLCRPLVSNSGVRAGALMPEVSVQRLSITRYEPEELLVKLKNVAKDVSGGNAIEVVALKSWLSAYYRFKDGYPLPLYHEPFEIEGLEDLGKNVVVVTNDFIVPIGVPVVGPHDGPHDDAWLTLPSKSDTYSDDKIYHRRKQKSVAELMGENTHVRPENQKRARVGEQTGFGKSGSARKRKTSDGVEGSGSHRASTIENIDVASAENTSVEAKEESEVVTTPRERKKSKYLSPPFMDLNSRITSRFKIKSEIGSDKVTEIAQGEERMTRASGEHFASLIVDEAPKEKWDYGEPEGPDNEVKNDETTVIVSDVNAPVNILLSEMQFAALDPLYLSKKGSLDMVWDFVSALRSSFYVEGSNYKEHSESKTGKKRESLNDITKKKAKSLDLIPCKSRTPKTAGKLADFKRKKVIETSVRTISAEKGEKASPARLILTFTPEFPLPSKTDILKLFGKFGSLNGKETGVVRNSHSVEIVYKKDSDAESAFKSSVIQSPFGSENVNYTLQHSSPSSGPRVSRSKVSSPLKRTPKKQGHPADELMSDVGLIKQKFEIMSAILENYCPKFSPEDKLSLKDEMKHLMEKVETVAEKVRIMAEKTSS